MYNFYVRLTDLLTRSRQKEWDIYVGFVIVVLSHWIIQVIPSLQQIEKYRNLAKEIMGLPSIEHFDMIRLDCEDLKRGLAEGSRHLANELLRRVSDDHRRENNM